MPAPVHPGRLLRRELKARELSANQLALDLGVPSGRITDILNERRSITADTAVRLGRYFGNRPQFWLDLQSQYHLAVVERERGRRLRGGCGQQTPPDSTGCGALLPLDRAGGFRGDVVDEPVDAAHLVDDAGGGAAEDLTRERRRHQRTPSISVFAKSSPT